MARTDSRSWSTVLECSVLSVAFHTEVKVVGSHHTKVIFFVYFAFSTDIDCYQWLLGSVGKIASNFALQIREERAYEQKSWGSKADMTSAD